MPSKLTYGGDYFNVTLPASAFASAADVNATTFVVERTGFSTHAMNMGMRHVELDSTVTVADDGSATFHVSQVPYPAILAPGPALLFCVVAGVPSNASWIMAGSGTIEEQTVEDAPALPTTSMPRSFWADQSEDASSSTAADGASQTGGASNGGSAGGSSDASHTRSVASAMGVLALGLVGLACAL